jgi:hypothetical protein
MVTIPAEVAPPLTRSGIRASSIQLAPEHSKTSCANLSKSPGLRLPGRRLTPPLSVGIGADLPGELDLDAVLHTSDISGEGYRLAT